MSPFSLFTHNNGWNSQKYIPRKIIQDWNNSHQEEEIFFRHGVEQMLVLDFRCLTLGQGGNHCVEFTGSGGKLSEGTSYPWGWAGPGASCFSTLKVSQSKTKPASTPSLRNNRCFKQCFTASINFLLFSFILFLFYCWGFYLLWVYPLDVFEWILPVLLYTFACNAGFYWSKTLQTQTFSFSTLSITVQGRKKRSR